MFCSDKAKFKFIFLVHFYILFYLFIYFKSIQMLSVPLSETRLLQAIFNKPSFILPSLSAKHFVDLTLFSDFEAAYVFVGDS